MQIYMYHISEQVFHFVFRGNIISNESGDEAAFEDDNIKSRNKTLQHETRSLVYDTMVEFYVRKSAYMYMALDKTILVCRNYTP